jgi:TetR/AcrR family transcriptional regulator, transcriptional repressor for nem operon
MKDTKQHILDIALRLFLQKTFKEVTMQEIVKKTGLSKGAFYHYFKSKELLFQEVLNTFLTCAMNIKWDTFPQDSLKNFISHLLAYSPNTLAQMGMGKDEIFHINYFSLFFDGLRLFPEFKTAIINHQRHELDAWIKIVGIARKNDEIKSSMTDEQIARIFIHTSDGIILSLILNRTEDVFSIIKNSRILWESFYLLIKA